MKQKTTDDNEVITRGILREELKELEKRLERKLESKLEEKMDEKLKRERRITKVMIDTAIEASELRTDDRARQYRDEILTKMDQIIGELAQIREDQLFMNHDIRELKKTDDDHEKRLKKVERRIMN